MESCWTAAGRRNVQAWRAGVGCDDAAPALVWTGTYDLDSPRGVESGWAAASRWWRQRHHLYLGCCGWYIAPAVARTLQHDYEFGVARRRLTARIQQWRQRRRRTVRMGAGE